MSPELEKLVEIMTLDLADNGKLIEFGWHGLRHFAIKADAPQVQLDEMRFAFYAGAQHLFGSLMAIMGVAGRRSLPTEQDRDRVELISKELAAFVKQYEAVIEGGRLSRGGWP